jgi:hypothetical protein
VSQYVMRRVGMGAVAYSGADPETKRLADAANLFYAKGNTERGDYFAAKFREHEALPWVGLGETQAEWEARNKDDVLEGYHGAIDEALIRDQGREIEMLRDSQMSQVGSAASKIGTGLMVAGAGLGAVVLYGIYKAVTR